MARTLGLLIVLVAIAVGGSVQAQDPAPSRSPLPFDSYLVRVFEVQAATDALSAELRPTTPAEFVAAFGEAMTIGARDLAGMREVAPEPCYAAAHEEILAYRGSIIEFTEPLLPLMAEAETFEGVLEVIERIDADMFARHPTAYTDVPGAQEGTGGSHSNILAALATCDAEAA